MEENKPTEAETVYFNESGHIEERGILSRLFWPFCLILGLVLMYGLYRLAVLPKPNVTLDTQITNNP